MSAADLIKGFEGCKLEAYQDLGGIWTIGWGHTGKDVYPGLKWTQYQADEALDHDILLTQAQIAVYSPNLSGEALESVTSFVFNLGIGAYRNSTFRTYVDAGNWSAARSEMVKWDHSNGNIVPGLYRRRQAEAALLA